MNIVLGIAAVLAFVLIGFGIYGHGKRLAIYETYGEFFGPVKAFIFLTLTVFGAFQTVLGIMSLFVAELAESGGGVQNILVGLVCAALGILLGYFTNKKAAEAGCGNIWWQMIVAGCGTFWHIELTIIQIVCFVWFIKRLTDRDE